MEDVQNLSTFSFPNNLRKKKNKNPHKTKPTQTPLSLKCKRRLSLVYERTKIWIIQEVPILNHPFLVLFLKAVIKLKKHGDNWTESFL